MESKDLKIRIVSFQNAHNFGAVCQAYGLQQTLYKMGYNDVMFINYNPDYLKQRYNPLDTWKYLDRKAPIFRRLIRIFKWSVYVTTSYFRNYQFNKSIRRLLKQTDKELHTKAEVAQIQADVLICGSDQIWNTSLTGQYDPVFFGYFDPSISARTIAYAPSTELSTLSCDNLSAIIEMISYINAISVRESSIRDVLQPHIKKNISVCVDPTILCGRDAYDNITAKRLVEKPYICVYSYFPKEQLVYDVLRTIPNYESYEIRYILFDAPNFSQAFDKEIHGAIPVEKFLSYIKYASYVVTNSFHGLAFSLLFEKNFCVTSVSNKSTRCKSLLQDINLMDRFVKEPEAAHWEEINYNCVNQELMKLRKASREFLVNSIEY